MANGTVKFFNDEKNFGFITGDDGSDYFVHGGAVEGRITEGDKVTFTAEDSPKGLRAVAVKKAEASK